MPSSKKPVFSSRPFGRNLLHNNVDLGFQPIFPPAPPSVDPKVLKKPRRPPLTSGNSTYSTCSSRSSTPSNVSKISATSSETYEEIPNCTPRRDGFSNEPGNSSEGERIVPSGILDKMSIITSGFEDLRLLDDRGRPKNRTLLINGTPYPKQCSIGMEEEEADVVSETKSTASELESDSGAEASSEAKLNNGPFEQDIDSGGPLGSPVGGRSSLGSSLSSLDSSSSSSSLHSQLLNLLKHTKRYNIINLSAESILAHYYTTRERESIEYSPNSSEAELDPDASSTAELNNSFESL